MLPAPTWFHAGGTAGGDHDHRDSDRAVAAGGAGGPRGGPAGAVPEQPQATRLGRHRPTTRPTAFFPTGGWSLPLDGRPGPRRRLEAAGGLDLQRPALHRTVAAPRPWGRDRLEQHDQAGDPRHADANAVCGAELPHAAAVHPLSLERLRQPDEQRGDGGHQAARSDYAGNAGDIYGANGGPWASGRRLSGSHQRPLGRQRNVHVAVPRQQLQRHHLPAEQGHTGADHRRPEQHVRGRREVHQSDFYATGQSASDNQGWPVGYDGNVIRFSSVPDSGHNVPYWPQQDTPGLETPNDGFGSAHAVGCHMAFCDGSVQLINYTINHETNRRLTNRADGLAVDAKSY